MSAPEDLDPDSLMGSSSASPADEDTDLFPEETTDMTNTHPTNIGRPLTPQNNHLNALAPGELSPPRSQSQVQSQLPIQPPPRNTTTDEQDWESTMANGNSRQTYYQEGSARDVPDAVGDGKPGSGWKSKRAQEEYHRAMDSIVDRDFNLREFGDILAVEKKAEK